MKGRRIVASFVLSASLVLGLAVTAPAPVSEAKGAKKVTMIKGESTFINVWGSQIKKVTSSKKSVIKAKKSGPYKVTIKAKKAGKSTVVIRAKNGKTLTYKFTVKNLKLTCKLSPIAGSRMIACEVVNKSGVYIGSAKFTYNLYDETGAVVERDKFSISSLVPGKTAYTYFYAANYDRVVSGGVEKKVELQRTVGGVYKDASKKVKVKVNMDSKSMTQTNKLNKQVSGYADVVYYNANGDIVGIESKYISLTAKGVYTVSLFPPNEYNNYKVFVRASYTA